MLLGASVGIANDALVPMVPLVLTALSEPPLAVLVVKPVPAVQVLVDGDGVMELGLGHRDLVVPRAGHVVGHAYRDLVQAG